MATLTAFVAMTSASQQPVKLPDHATQIRIQVMDSRAHLPLKGRRVQVAFAGPDGQLYNKAPYKVGQTDSDGIVAFDFNEPIPPFIDVFLWYAYRCSDKEVYSTRSILDDGVVATWRLTGNKKADKWCAADSQAPQPQEQPGKVVIFVHPMNRLIWSWYDTFR